MINGSKRYTSYFNWFGKLSIYSIVESPPPPHIHFVLVSFGSPLSKNGDFIGIHHKVFAEWPKCKLHTAKWERDGRCAWCVGPENWAIIWFAWNPWNFRRNTPSFLAAIPCLDADVYWTEQIKLNCLCCRLQNIQFIQSFEQTANNLESWCDTSSKICCCVLWNCVFSIISWI